MLLCLLTLTSQIFGFPSHVSRSDLDATLDLEAKITDQPVFVKFDRPDLVIPSRFGRSNPPNPVRFGRSDQPDVPVRLKRSDPAMTPVRFGRSDQKLVVNIPVRYGRSDEEIMTSPDELEGSDQMDISSRFGSSSILGAIPGLENLIVWCGLI